LSVCSILAVGWGGGSSGKGLTPIEPTKARMVKAAILLETRLRFGLRFYGARKRA
jgi:hypothetical protein